MAARVESDATDGPVFALPAFSLALDDKRFHGAFGKAHLAREQKRAFGGEHHVPAVVHDPARKLDGIFDSGNRGHGAGTKRAPFHDRRIHLYFAKAVERRAGAGVEARIVLEGDDCSFGGIYGGAALLKKFPNP